MTTKPTIQDNNETNYAVQIALINQTLSNFGHDITELKDMIKAIKDVLQETPPELAADIIDSGIIMTGGTSQLRNLTELVFRRIGVKAVVAKDPLYCVAKGTGTALEHLETYKKSIIAKR